MQSGMKMNHRKARSYSEISETPQEVSSSSKVPFSWEEKPGTPKFIIHSCQSHAPEQLISTTINGGGSIHQLPLRKSASFHFQSPVDVSTMKISPPPFEPHHHKRALSQRSSRKSLWKQQHYQDDPFAAAIKKCTKSIAVNQGMAAAGGSSKNKGKNHPKITLSCKKSCDVRDDNLVDKIPPLPTPRTRGKNKGRAR